jgi:hypothetical protein
VVTGLGVLEGATAKETHDENHSTHGNKDEGALHVFGEQYY